MQPIQMKETFCNSINLYLYLNYDALTHIIMFDLAKDNAIKKRIT